MVDDLTTVLFPSQGLTTLPLCPPSELVCCAAAGPGGHPLRVLLDTGTDPSAMDAGLARRLALRTGGRGIGQGAASDEVPFTEAVLPWLRLGDLTIRDLFAPALDLSGLPFQIDVVLGYNVLRQVALRIDYRQRLLTLAHPDLGAPPERAAVSLPMAFFEHFPALRDIEVDGRHIPLATIDTGSNAALTVGPDVAAALGLSLDQTGVRQAIGAGFGGGGAVLRGSFRPVRLGPLALADVELDTPDVPRGDLVRSGRANIGNRLLSRFAAVALDYERRIVTFEPDD
ncbi:MAG: clan AA aspartic protease [Kouleothrix sp.]|nr:clan AA aspartic protease [Kouleothrix sp.]